MLKKVVIIALILILSSFLYSQTFQIDFGVLDKNNNFFPELKPTDIQIKLKKQILKIKSLEIKRNVPTNVIIMIDASASQERMLPLEKETAKEFIDNVLNTNKDKVGVVKFSGNLLLEQDLTTNFALAKEKIDGIQIVLPSGYVGNLPVIPGATSIWDSLKQVITSIEKLPQTKSRNVILLISDGVNTSGKAKVKETIKKAQEAKTPIYAIGIGDKKYSGVNEKNLKRITTETGGSYIIVEKKEDFPDLVKVFKNSLLQFYKVNLETSEPPKKGRFDEIYIKIISLDFQNKKLKFFTQKKIVFR